jgi:hypothetical protein
MEKRIVVRRVGVYDVNLATELPLEAGKCGVLRCGCSLT